MKVILDTNIWISFLLGKRLSLLREIVDIRPLVVLLKELHQGFRRFLKVLSRYLKNSICK